MCLRVTGHVFESYTQSTGKHLCLHSKVLADKFLVYMKAIQFFLAVKMVGYVTDILWKLCDGG